MNKHMETLTAPRLWTEAFVVAGVLTIIFASMRTLVRFNNVTIQVALTGVLGHVLMELLKVNAYYCNNGNACLPKKEFTE